MGLFLEAVYVVVVVFVRQNNAQFQVIFMRTIAEFNSHSFRIGDVFVVNRFYLQRKCVWMCSRAREKAWAFGTHTFLLLHWSPIFRIIPQLMLSHRTVVKFCFIFSSLGCFDITKNVGSFYRLHWLISFPAICHSDCFVSKLKAFCFVSHYRCQYFFFKHPWAPAFQGVITFFVIANFTLATFMDPGVIPKGKGSTNSVAIRVVAPYYIDIPINVMQWHDESAMIDFVFLISYSLFRSHFSTTWWR